MAAVATVFDAAEVVPDVDRDVSDVPVVGFSRTLFSRAIVFWAVAGLNAVVLPPAVEPVPELPPDELPELELLELLELLEPPDEPPLDELLDELLPELLDVEHEIPQMLKSWASNSALDPPPPAQPANDRHAATRDKIDTPRMIPIHTITVLLKMEMFR